MPTIRPIYRKLLAICVAGAFAARAPAAEPNPLLANVPANAQLAVYTTSLAESAAAFSKTEFGAELTGKSFASLVAALRKQNLGGPLHLRPWIGLDWPELATVKSPAVLAVFPQPRLPGGALPPPGVVLLVASPPGSPEAAALRVAVTAYYARQGWAAKKTTTAQATFTTFAPPAGAKEEYERVWFESSTYCGVALTTSAANRIVTLKPGQSLLSAAAFPKPAPMPADKNSAIRVFVQPIPLWESTNNTVPPVKPPKITDRLARARRLGMGGVTSISGAVHFDKPLAGWQFDGQMNVQLPYQKALRAIDLTPGAPVPLPRWVDGDAIAAASWRWDFPTAIKAFGNVFDESTEPGPDGEGFFDQLLDGIKEDPEGPMIDLRKDLFARLGPEVLQVSRERPAVAPAKVVPAKAADKKRRQDTGTWVLEAHCKDEKAVLAVLLKYFKGDNLVTARTIGKFSTWTVDDGGALLVEGESESPATIRGVAIGEGKVLLATHRKTLIDAVEARPAAAAPLAVSKTWDQFDAWRKTVEKPTTAYRGWTKPGGTWRTAYEQARNPLPKFDDDAAAQAWMFLLFGTTERTAALPYKDAPAFDVFKSAFGSVGTVMSKSPAGWELSTAELPRVPKAK